MTLTDNDREIVRWFAEECLGIAVCRDFCDQEDNLIGWLGFGRVVDAIEKRGFAWTLERATATEYGVEVYQHEDGEIIHKLHTDPAIAAIMALRQAVEQVVT